MFDNILSGIAGAFEPMNLVFLIAGVLAGVIFGALPGLTGPMAITLFIPVTYTLGVTPALIFLSGIYSGSVYGGSITSILMKIPGDPGNAATCFDGYAMAQKGEASKALGYSAICSALGGLFSGIVLLFAAPALARVALAFGPAEYFALAFMGITAISSLGTGSQIKALMACVVGLLLGCVGTDQISGNMRMTFGSSFLIDGIQFIPALIGLFAITEMFEGMIKKTQKGELVTKKASTKLPSFKELWSHKWLMLKTAIIGTWIGILPGTGATLANFLGYSEAIRSSKHPEKFGTGIPEGVVGPETANNAAVGGSFVPTLALGIPGSGAQVLILSAMMLHGLRPGPMIFSTQPDMVFAVIIAFILSNLVFLGMGYFGTRYFGKLLQIPYQYLNPIIIIMCVIGSFALRNNFGDVAVMFIVGFIGYILLRICDFPVAPLILGFVLGPLMEYNYRRADLIADSTIGIFTRPITAVIMVISIFFLAYPHIKKAIKRRRGNKQAEQQGCAGASGGGAE